MALYIRCQYEEGKPETYEGIQVVTQSGKVLYTADTGFDERDLLVVSKWIERTLPQATVYETSSVLSYSQDLQARFKRRNWKTRPWNELEAVAFRERHKNGQESNGSH
jgi:hypothetical protein